MGTDVVTNAFNLDHARRTYKENDPPVEINQRWVCFDSDGNVFRRIRIIALHPDMGSDEKRQWIYLEEPAKMRTSYGELRVCPEFNLRYIFSLENG